MGIQLDPIWWTWLQWNLAIISTIVIQLVIFYVLYKYRMRSPEYEYGKALIQKQALEQSQIIKAQIRKFMETLFPELAVRRGEVLPEEKEKAPIPVIETVEQFNEIVEEARRLGIPIPGEIKEEGK